MSESELELSKLEDWLGDRVVMCGGDRFDVGKEAALKLLEVARTKCEEHYTGAERIVDEHNPEEAWGEMMSANDLLEWMEKWSGK